MSGVTATLGGTTTDTNGVYISGVAIGPATLSAITLTVSGPVNNGLELNTTDSEANSLSNAAVSIAGAATSGITVDSQGGSGGVKMSNLSATIGGAVAQAGVYVSDLSTGVLSCGGVTSTLTGSGANAADGVTLLEYNGPLAITGPVTTKILGPAAGGIIVSGGAFPVTVSGPLTSTLESSADYGVSVNGEEGVVVAAAVVASIAGNVTYEGIDLEATGGNLSVAAPLTSTIGGTAANGVYLYSASGTLSDAAGVSDTVNGTVTNDGLDAVASSGLTLGTAKVTLKNGAGTGADLEVGAGNLTDSGLTVAVSGTVSGDGVYLQSSSAVTTTGLSVSLSSTAQYGVYVQAVFPFSLTNTNVGISGAVTDNGVYAFSKQSGTVSKMTVTLGGTSAGAVDLSGELDDLSVAELTVTEAGQAAGDGVYLYSEYGGVSWSGSTVILNAGVTPDSGDAGVAADAGGGNLVISRDTVIVDSDATAGLLALADGVSTITGNTIKTEAVTSPNAALELTEQSGNPETISGNTFSTSGTGTGIYFNDNYGNGINAMVFGNNFVNNLVGVEIIGSGTSPSAVGNIDLGGGALSSAGKNNFGGFTGTAGHYAISLQGTAANAVVYALHDTFTASNPNTTVQDAANGGGIGIIDV